MGLCSLQVHTSLKPNLEYLLIFRLSLGKMMLQRNLGTKCFVSVFAVVAPCG